MNKHRVNTTISAKSWELLKKYAAEYGTQQKALEFALENLENGKLQGEKLSQQEQFWLQAEKLNVVCLVHRDIFYELFKTANCEQLNELLMKQDMVGYMVAMYYEKPLKECSLKEVMNGIVAISNAGKAFDSFNYKDDGNHYTIKISHSARTINYSNSIKILFETLFKAYGVKTHSDVSENNLFIKVEKKYI